LDVSCKCYTFRIVFCIPLSTQGIHLLIFSHISSFWKLVMFYIRCWRGWKLLFEILYKKPAAILSWYSWLEWTSFDLFCWKMDTCCFPSNLRY
jgi:hypothetical protein